MTPLTVTLPDCLDDTAAPLRIRLTEGAAKITINGDHGEVAHHVEIDDLISALHLLASHDQRLADRAQATRDALPERERALQQELDAQALRAANDRIAELIDLLEEAEAQNRELTATAGAIPALPPGDESDPTTDEAAAPADPAEEGEARDAPDIAAATAAERSSSGEEAT